LRAELYWIGDSAGGRLAIMPRPRGGDWLGDEVASWKLAGLDIVVSLLRDDEIAELNLVAQPSLCEELGIVFVRFPIGDRQVPDSPDDFLALVTWLEEQLRGGHRVGVHCRMGIGRSSLLAACLLVKSGYSSTAAFSAISRDRGVDVPDTKNQVDWVETVAGRLRRKMDTK
jgi:hypothetical protein